MHGCAQYAARLESRYRIFPAGIVYNNFPWPENPNGENKAAPFETAAQGVLDARAAISELDVGPTSTIR